MSFEPILLAPEEELEEIYPYRRVWRTSWIEVSLLLIAVLAIYMTAVVVLYPPATRREEGVSPAAWGGRRVWALGLIGALVAQTVYSQLDAVTMGAKTNFMWWWMFGLVLSLSNLSLRLSEPRSTGFYAVSSESEELGFSRSGSASLRSE